MKIAVNGKEREIPDGITVQDLLEHLNLHPRRVAVELNRTIVKRPQFSETVVCPGDAIEILQFVGGG